MKTSTKIPEIIGLSADKKDLTLSQIEILGSGKEGFIVVCNNKEHKTNELDLDYFPQFKDEINIILDYDENKFGPLEIEDKHIFISYENGIVRKDKAQRDSYWHIDLMSTPARIYMYASTAPTEFLLEEHDIDNEEFIPKDNNIWSANKDEIVVADSFHIHRSPTVIEDCWRRFLRLTIAEMR